MSNQTGPFAPVAKLARIALILTLVVAGIGFVGNVALGVVALLGSEASAGQGAGFFVMALVALIIGAWAGVGYGLVRVLIANEQQVYTAASRLERLESGLSNQADSLKHLRELASVSDKAKGLLHRDREMEAFREAVHHSLLGQDYDSAEQLIARIDQELGYANEARQLRAEVEEFRNKTEEEKIQAAIDRVQRFVDRRDWQRALREAQRLSTLFVGNTRIIELPQQIHAARTKHKRELLQAYGEATRKNDVDRSIELLKQLDAYLTPAEAAALSESARGVFKARLNNLGVQFAIFVEDEQWSQAIAAGQEIMREFPNSRMAQEVREKLPALQARASSTTTPLQD